MCRLTEELRLRRKGESQSEGTLTEQLLKHNTLSLSEQADAGKGLQLLVGSSYNKAVLQYVLYITYYKSH